MPGGQIEQHRPATTDLAGWGEFHIGPVVLVEFLIWKHLQPAVKRVFALEASVGQQVLVSTAKGQRRSKEKRRKGGRR